MAGHVVAAPAAADHARAPGAGEELTEPGVELRARAVVAEMVRDYDAFLLDCDGTLYHAGRLLPHVADAVGHLRSLGKKVFFVTNTSSRSSEQLRSKLAGMGVACDASECVPSGVFTAHYIRQKHPDAKRVYAIGGQGLLDELRRVGLEASGGPPEDGEVFQDTGFEALAAAVAAERYDGVVVGWDTALNYHKIVKSSLVFQKHPDCFFYATNADPADRVGDSLLPGNGCLLPAIEAACGACAPHRRVREGPQGTRAVSLGKPNPEYARLVAEWNGVDVGRCVMVGDRLDTDVEMARLAGMGSCFVLTGVDGLAQIEEKGVRPRHVLPSFGAVWTHRGGG